MCGGSVCVYVRGTLVWKSWLNGWEIFARLVVVVASQSGSKFFTKVKHLDPDPSGLPILDQVLKDLDPDPSLL